MEAAAKLTTKGQITVPKAVRDAHGRSVDDEVIFRVDGTRPVLARTTDFLALAGSISVPARKRGVAWPVASFDRSIDRATTIRRIEP